ncbi:MAG: hypothetical protein OXT67_04350 [Zetaproteobacteria bacterium]|nr:hypothetical protein [Zetaproteobacteria bacterium]
MTQEKSNVVDLGVFRRKKQDSTAQANKAKQVDEQWTNSFRKILQKNMDIESKLRKERGQANLKILKRYRLT